MTVSRSQEARLAARRSRAAIRWLVIATAAFPAFFFLLDRLARAGRFEAFGALFFGFLLVMLVTGIRWVRWFGPLYRAAATTGRARFASGGLWFWAWVVPYGNLFLPKYLVNDVWWAADEPGRRSRLPRVVQWWWALWVGTEVVAMASRFAPHPAWLAVVAVLAVVDTVLAIGVVRVLTSRVQSLVRVPVFVNSLR